MAHMGHLVQKQPKIALYTIMMAFQLRPPPLPTKKTDFMMFDQ